RRQQSSTVCASRSSSPKKVCASDRGRLQRNRGTRSFVLFGSQRIFRNRRLRGCGDERVQLAVGDRLSVDLMIDTLPGQRVAVDIRKDGRPRGGSAVGRSP